MVLFFGCTRNENNENQWIQKLDSLTVEHKEKTDSLLKVLHLQNEMIKNLEADLEALEDSIGGLQPGTRKGQKIPDEKSGGYPTIVPVPKTEQMGDPTDDPKQFKDEKQ